MKAMAAINIAAKQLGLDEDTQRDLYERVTGKRSLRDMTPGQHGLVLDELRSKGAPDKRRLPGQYAGKLQALWISGWNLGLIHNAADEALLAFVKGRTGIDHTRFLRNAADAKKAVEALKSWLGRAGVDWSEHVDPQDCVISAQIRLLGIDRSEIHVTITGATTSSVQKLTKVALMQLLGAQIRARPAAPDAGGDHA